MRNGSRGATWLEPLVEVEVDEQRIAYGPVTKDDVDSLFESGFLNGGNHPLKLGPTEEIPFLFNQERWTFVRCGIIDPLSVDDYTTHQGFDGLKIAFDKGPKYVIEEVLASGLRGRGGAGFPTGIKWKTVADTDNAQKYLSLIHI